MKSDSLWKKTIDRLSKTPWVAISKNNARLEGNKKNTEMT